MAEPATSFKLEIRGPECTAAARELGEAVKATLGEAPRQLPVKSPEPRTTRGDPVAVAALILAIPGAVLATFQVAEKLRALIQKKEEIEKGYPGIEIVLETPANSEIELTVEHVTEIIDVAIQSQDSER